MSMYLYMSVWVSYLCLCSRDLYSENCFGISYKASTLGLYPVGLIPRSGTKPCGFEFRWTHVSAVWCNPRIRRWQHRASMGKAKKCERQSVRDRVPEGKSNIADYLNGAQHERRNCSNCFRGGGNSMGCESYEGAISGAGYLFVCSPTEQFPAAVFQFLTHVCLVSPVPSCTSTVHTIWSTVLLSTRRAVYMSGIL